jgi:uncharacterized membrane protein YvlD (DUF360 family)
MRRILLRAAARLVAWALGLLLADWAVPDVAVSVSGFVVAVVLFSVVQTTLSYFILKLPHGFAALLLGGAGLIMTLVAMMLAAALTHGLTIGGGASWLAATLVVWLSTTIGAILLPDVYDRSAVRPT